MGPARRGGKRPLQGPSPTYNPPKPTARRERRQEAIGIIPTALKETQGGTAQRGWLCPRCGYPMPRQSPRRRQSPDGEDKASLVSSLMTRGGGEELPALLAALDARFKSRVRSEVEDAAEILRLLALEGPEPVRKEIASSASLAFAPDTLFELATDPCPAVRAALASNALVAMRVELVDLLSKDAPEVRDALANNAFVSAASNV